VLRDPRSLLKLNYRELIEDGLREFKRGNAKLWLADQLSPTWASRPERTLGRRAQDRATPTDRVPGVATSQGRDP
jgi:hypothetical protein